MRFEIVNRNEPEFNHFVLLPTIELIGELYNDDDNVYEGYYEYSLGVSFLNFSIWMIWIR